MSVTDEKTLLKVFRRDAGGARCELARETLQIEADAILRAEGRACRRRQLRAGGRAAAGLQRPRGGVRHRQVRPYRAARSRPRWPRPAPRPCSSTRPKPPTATSAWSTENDAFIAISNSGETAELLAIVPHHQAHGRQADRHDRQRRIEPGAAVRRPPERPRSPRKPAR